ncbi:SRPBCC family protein [Flexivirga sp. ID2601S]|uniref:SRPBCC family protein n=1 Tax=Flexivirga aerilata TaxID=1656889 RepID=A0A849AHX5_9MICO|nr:SRPBCC family protein [Flexivirga aerilata]
MKEIVVTADSSASVARLWQVVSDWDAHSRAFPFTRMTVLAGDPGVGQRLDAITAIGPVRMHDPMTVVRWEPPGESGASAALAIHKTGRVLGGDATVEVTPTATGSRLTWRTDVGPAPAWLRRLSAPASGPVGGLVYRHAVGRLVAEAEHG